MHSVITEWGGDKCFREVTMGAAEEELCTESEIVTAAEGKIAECDLSSVLERKK